MIEFKLSLSSFFILVFIDNFEINYDLILMVNRIFSLVIIIRNFCSFLVNKCLGEIEYKVC